LNGESFEHFFLDGQRASFDQPAVVPTDDFREDVALGQALAQDWEMGQLTQRFDSVDKITLFRSLFRGREDVIAPVYKPENWSRGICTGLRERMDPWCVREAQDQMRRMSESPVSAGNRSSIRQHLSGHDEFGREFVNRVYPLLLDETCFLLAVDLDGNTWEKDAGAFSGDLPTIGVTCCTGALPIGQRRTYLDFFAEAISATVARNFGSHLLT